ncbi:hypothetical protein KNE206_30670 [Kitasatospora sp. NE20-6]|uniref:hypothetical protein n=1 Tax=Kitasatospora sp. NE20-6 TaxID=2859066 RepID=UPI0034DC080C
MHLVMSNDFAAILSAVMAALLLLLIAEFQAGVRGNAEVARSLAEEYKDVIKESVLEFRSGTELPTTDHARVEAGVARYQALRRAAQRHVGWQYLLLMSGAGLAFGLGAVVVQMARDEKTRGDASGLTLFVLLITGASLVLVAAAFGLRFRHAYKFARLKWGYQLSDMYEISDVKAVLELQERWERSRPDGPVMHGLFSLASAHVDFRQMLR